jgi:histidine triad (HIT) family protein
MTTIFSKIIKRELPAEIVFESEKIIVIKDLHPVAPVHLLIISKEEIPCLQKLKSEELPLLAEMFSVAQELAQQFGIAEGYRLLTNNGESAGQTILHLHFHLIGGRHLGALA